MERDTILNRGNDPESFRPGYDTTGFRISLVELLAISAECRMLSDLHTLDYIQRINLASHLETLPARDEDLFDWNDALDYLADAPPELTAANAKVKLIAYLRASAKS